MINRFNNYSIKEKNSKETKDQHVLHICFPTCDLEYDCNDMRYGLHIVWIQFQQISIYYESKDAYMYRSAHDARALIGMIKTAMRDSRNSEQRKIYPTMSVTSHYCLNQQYWDPDRNGWMLCGSNLALPFIIGSDGEINHTWIHNCNLRDGSTRRVGELLWFNKYDDMPLLNPIPQFTSFEGRWDADEIKAKAIQTGLIQTGRRGILDIKSVKTERYAYRLTDLTYSILIDSFFHEGYIGSPIRFNSTYVTQFLNYPQYGHSAKIIFDFGKWLTRNMEENV